MLEFVLGAQEAFEVFLVNSGGAPVTGVLKAQIDPYYIKAGGSATQLSSSAFSWTEHSATHMPGFYRLTLNSTGASAAMDTLGSFLMNIKTNAGPPSFLAYPIIGRVVQRRSSDLLIETWGISGVNYRIFPTAWDSVTHEVITATLRVYPTAADTVANTNHLKEITLAATYNVDGTLASYRVSG